MFTQHRICKKAEFLQAHGLKFKALICSSFLSACTVIHQVKSDIPSRESLLSPERVSSSSHGHEPSPESCRSDYTGHLGWRLTLLRRCVHNYISQESAPTAIALLKLMVLKMSRKHFETVLIGIMLQVWITGSKCIIETSGKVGGFCVLARCYYVVCSGSTRFTVFHSVLRQA